MNTIYITHENIRQSGEHIRTVGADHPFFRMPEVQGPGFYMNRYETEAEIGNDTVKVRIGSLTDYPVRHNPAVSDAILNKSVAHVREGQP